MTGSRAFTVTAKSDHIARHASASALMAVAELIWNALDADAMRVDLHCDRGPLTMERIVVRDDGTGITHDEAPSLFNRLGGSWKAQASTTKVRKRFLHGRGGKGRFKAFALGRVADWNVTYRDTEGLRSFKVAVIEDDLGRGTISDPSPATRPETGVEVVISELHRDIRTISTDEGRQALTEIFAAYLLLYPDVRISVDGVLLDPASAIAHRQSYPLPPIDDGVSMHGVMLEVIEWTRTGLRSLYLCGEKGLPLLTVEERLPAADRSYCAYVKSSAIQELSDRNELGLGELSGNLRQILSDARHMIREHLRRRAAAEAQDVVQAWKNENVYPYAEPPATPAEAVTREIFDIVAVTAARHIDDFEKASPLARRLQLRTLSTAIERGNEEIQFVLGEVIKLPKRELAQFASLLRETSLSAIVAGTSIVSDRMKVITGIEALVHEEKPRRILRERTQLHRIVADNTWLFGDEFHLMADDEGLNRCLVQHAAARQIRVLNGAPVIHPTKTSGRVDLMLGRQRRPHGDAELEHLIVELKAPKIAIRQKEVGQIENYAQAVVGDARFDKNRTRWLFCALSREVDEAYLAMRQIEGEPAGVIAKSSNLTIMVRTWASLLDENRARLKFFGDALSLRVTRDAALMHFRERYPQMLDGVLDQAGDGATAAVNDDNDLDTEHDDE